MLLCVDIGNTNIKIGLFEDNELRARWRLTTDRARLADEYAMLLLQLFESGEIRRESITGCAISSVVPTLTPVFLELAQRYLDCTPLIINPLIDYGMRIKTDDPREVGPDLIMNALAARELYGSPVIVISFGTATTFTAVSKAGDLEGVAIAPGIITSADSLFKAASVLPQVALERPPAALGHNTIDSLRSGMVLGFAALVEGLVKRFQTELGGEAFVVATGGLAEVISSETEVIQAVEPDLALIGLRLAYERMNSN